MNYAQAGGLLLSVALISSGQLMFKYVGVRLAAEGFSDLRAGLVAALSFAVYGAATVIWILLLRTVPLSRAYPFMAASFILVPLGSSLLYGETLKPQYLAGVLLIAVGVAVAASSR